MKKEDCFLLGHVAKSHGFKGDISIKLDVDDPSRYAGMDACFIEINQQLTPFFFNQVTITNKGMAKVRIEDLNTPDATKHLVGCSVFLPLGALPKLTGNEFYFHEVIGFDVIDSQKGNIGQIKDFMDQTSQTVMITTKEDIEILIPITASTINKVDRESKTIEINTPEGLIDLYL